MFLILTSKLPLGTTFIWILIAEMKKLEKNTADYTAEYVRRIRSKVNGPIGWNWTVQPKVDGLEPNWTVIWAKVDGSGR